MRNFPSRRMTGLKYTCVHSNIKYKNVSHLIPLTFQIMFFMYNVLMYKYSPFVSFRNQLRFKIRSKSKVITCKVLQDSRSFEKPLM